MLQHSDHAFNLTAKFLEVLKTLVHVAILASLSACGASRDDAHIASSESDMSGMIAVPINPETGKRAWGGGEIDLVVADAWASCSGYAGFQHMVEDKYFRQLAEKMRTTVRENGSFSIHNYALNNPISASISGRSSVGFTGMDWLTLRNTKYSNFEPNTKARLSLGLNSQIEAFKYSAHEHGPLAIPDVHLCIARTLQDQLKDSTLSKLLLPVEDQLQILKFAKDSAQIAMLEFSRLALAFSDVDKETIGIDPKDSDADKSLTRLREWIAKPSRGPHEFGEQVKLQLPASLAADWASSVSLHVVLARELAELLERFASAGKPIPGQSLVNAVWGPGSWRQRALASLYGGNPVSGRTGELDLGDLPGMSVGDTPESNSPEYTRWPDGSEAGWITTDVTEPQVAALLQLARNADELTLERVTEGESDGVRGSCFPIDAAVSADHLYRAVEAHLRAAGCAMHPNGGCTSQHLPTSQELERESASFLLWINHRITLQHARTLAGLLSEMIPTHCVENAFTGSQGQASQRVYWKGGAQGIDGTITHEQEGQRQIVYITPDTTFPARVLQELQPLYARLSNYNLPQTRHPLLTQELYGSDLESLRSVGSVSALIATREVILAAMGPKSLGGIHQEVVRGPANYVEQTFAPSFFKHMRTMLDVIAAAVGDTSVTISANTQSLVNDHLTTNLSDRLEDTGQDWHVNVELPRNSTWWNAAESHRYQLWVVEENGLTANAVVHPNSSIAGAQTPAGLTDAAGTLPSAPVAEIATFTGTSTPLMRWTFAINLPTDGKRRTFFVRKSGVVPEYKLLAGSVLLRPTADRNRLKQGYGTGGSLFIGTGGMLNSIAQRILTPDPDQPSHPKYDAFGLPRRWFPPMNSDLASPSMAGSVVETYLMRARESAARSKDATKRALDDYADRLLDRAQRNAAELRSEQVGRHSERQAVERNRSELSQICGVAGDSCKSDLVPINTDLERVWDTSPAIRSVRADTGESSEPIQEPKTRLSYRHLRDAVCKAPASGDTAAQLSVSEELQCLAISAIESLPVSVSVLDPVARQSGSPTVPTFDEYSGGSFQSLAIEQWRGLQTLREKVRNLIAATDAAVAHVETFRHAVKTARLASSHADAFQEEFKVQVDMMSERCSDKELSLAALKYAFARDGGSIFRSGKVGHSGWSEEHPVSFSMSTSEPTEVYSSGFVMKSASSGYTISTMSLADMRRLCNSYTEKHLAAKRESNQRVSIHTQTLAQSVAAQVDAFGVIAARIAELPEATGRMASLASAVLGLRNRKDLAMSQQKADAELAVERQKLEVRMLETTQVGEYLLNRRRHADDVWQAEALLEDARRAAVLARRAIEARYLVDLSTMRTPLVGVANPSVWADEVYDVGTRPSRATGSAIRDHRQSDTISEDSMVQYVANLTATVQGLAEVQRAGVAPSDSEVVSVPGFAVNSDESINPGARRWSFHCPANTGNGEWRALPPNGQLADVCEVGRPDRARILFDLDAWGRIGGDIAVEPYHRRYNARWTKLAVNVVGQNVVNTPGAGGESSKSFVRYNLSHRGPSWVVTPDQRWRVQQLPTGHIEGGKAVASDQTLNPITNSWPNPHVAEAARFEFNERPFAGTYELELILDSAIHPERITDVQILTGSTYWVQQN